MANPGFVRLYSRVALVGFWSVLVGAVAVFLATRLLPAGAQKSTTARVSIAPLIAAGLGSLVDAGIASVVAGLLLLVFGIRLSASAASV